MICIQPRNEPALVEVRDSLGAITSEMKHVEFISEFVSVGPNNCAYKTVNSLTGECKAVCEFRGITLTYSASQLINFDELKTSFSKDTRKSMSLYARRRKLNAGEMGRR